MIQEWIQDWNMEYELWTSWYFATWFDPLQERTSLIRFLVQREIARGEGKSGLSPKYLLALHASSLYVPWHKKRLWMDNFLQFSSWLWTSHISPHLCWQRWPQWSWGWHPCSMSPLHGFAESSPEHSSERSWSMLQSNHGKWTSSSNLQRWTGRCWWQQWHRISSGVNCSLQVGHPNTLILFLIQNWQTDAVTQWPTDAFDLLQQKNHSHSPGPTIWGEFIETLLPRFYHPLAFWCLWNFRLCLSNDLFNPAAERWWKPRLSWRHFQGATPVDSEGGWWEQSPGQIQFLGRRCQKKRWKRKGGNKKYSTVHEHIPFLEATTSEIAPMIGILDLNDVSPGMFSFS